ncbi:MAG: quinone-dependent dihydroorotate dehydrogenase [Bacteroidetes bacterium]|nr:quinone-dependent dihydroorotate dehydrogenase [Bacteroidota bacterium]
MEAILRRWLLGLDPELSHQLGFAAAWLGDQILPRYIEKSFEFEHPILRQRIWGMDFPNPIGLAAGCDKNGLLLSFWERLGFGHIEIGSVTLTPSGGNPRPRLFRLPEDRAIINRLGLPSKGAHKVAQRLLKISDYKIPLGINIARTDHGDAVVEDYSRCIALLLPHAKYLTINISCPNTEGGQILATVELLDALLSRLDQQVGKQVPILLKLSPAETAKVVYDSQPEAILETAMNHEISGFVVTNTAEDRHGLTTNTERLDTIGRGGLSGPPIHQRAIQMIKYVRANVGSEYPIIGVGGVSSARDVYSMICAGASLVQLYTALVYEGPSLVKRIKEDLVKLLQSDGHTSIVSAIGTVSGLADAKLDEDNKPK